MHRRSFRVPLLASPIQRQDDANRQPLGIERSGVEHVPDVDLDSNADVGAGPEVDAAPTLQREVVDAAGAAVIEADDELRIRQHPVVGVRAHTEPAHRRDDGAADEMIEADFADRSDERRVALERAGEIEVGAGVAFLARFRGKRRLDSR